MDNSFNLFEIILFAMLAAFLVYRLRSVLGKRTGNENRRPSIFSPREKDAERDTDNVVNLPDNHYSAPADGDDASPLAAGLAQIKIADRSFDEREFMKGAQVAFEMVVTAFAGGDGKTLNTLLSPDVYQDFANAIRQRELANRTLETTLVGIDSVDMLEIEMQGSLALVTVKFVSEQINVTVDENNEVVEGDRSSVITVTDIWTFSRDTNSSNPNWKLVATRSPS